MAALSINPAALESVFGWLEQNGGQPVQLWGWENGRRAALLAYSDGPGDEFGWSNWAAAARQDPSELRALFQQFELQMEDAQAAQITAAFPGGAAPMASATQGKATQGEAIQGEATAPAVPPATSSFLGLKL